MGPRWCDPPPKGPFLSRFFTKRTRRAEEDVTRGKARLPKLTIRVHVPFHRVARSRDAGLSGVAVDDDRRHCQSARGVLRYADRKTPSQTTRHVLGGRSKPASRGHLKTGQ